jgi:dihydroorotate dehydrogenase electron transfer subunit
MLSVETVLPKEVEVEVLDNQKISETGFLLTLFGKIPAPQPGQFVMLGLPRGAGPFLRRPFSVLEFKPKEKRLHIYYSVLGCGTRILSDVSSGEKLELLGPLGRAFPQGSGEVDVIVGGGRGVSPLVFLSRRRSRTRKVLFFAGAASEKKIVFLDKVKAREIFVSTEDGSLGKKGTVLELLTSVTSSRRLDWSRATLYGCGPAGMLRGLHVFSLQFKVPCFVSLEARMGCGVGVCQGCAVKTAKSGYRLVCKDGPVFSSALIDWDKYAGANSGNYPEAKRVL